MSREVSAAVPIRMPPGTCADASPDTAFSESKNASVHQVFSVNMVRTVDGDAEEVTNLLDLGPG